MRYYTRSVTLSTDTVAYAVGDLLADVQEIANCALAGLGCKIVSVCIDDDDSQGSTLDLHLQTTSTTFGTENAAPTITGANVAAGSSGVVVTVPNSAYVAVGATCKRAVVAVGEVAATSATGSLYLAVVTQGTPTHTASGIKVTLGIEAI